MRIAWIVVWLVACGGNSSTSVDGGPDPVVDSALVDTSVDTSTIDAPTAPEGVDPTFGIGGLVIGATDQPGEVAPAAAARQPDGKLVVVASPQHRLEHLDAFIVTRLAVDGALDPTFGIGGTVLIPGTAQMNAMDVAIAADGAIYVAGGRRPLGNAIVRLTATGAIDTAFGAAGFVSRTLPLQSFGIAADGDRVLIVEDSKLTRLSVDGSPDATFGTAGTVTFPGRLVVDATVDPVTANVIIIGRTTSITGFVARYTAAGQPDPTFNNTPSGEVSIENTQLRTVALSGDRIVAAGTAAPQGGVVVRITAAGAIDTTFDTDGRVPVFVTVQQLAAAADGAIYVFAGSAILKLAPDGSADPTFPPALQPAMPLPVAVIADPGGFFVFGRLTFTTLGQQLVALKYGPTGVPVTAFGDQGRTLMVPPARETVVDLQLAPDGSIVGLLQATARVPTAMVRMSATGALDPAFGTGGILVPAEPVLPWSIAVDASSRIYAAGDRAIVRYSPAGVLDTGYTADLLTGTSEPAVLAVAGDKLYAAAIQDRLLYIERRLDTGARDPAFNGGLATLPLNAPEVHRLIIQPDGKPLVLVGEAVLMLVRFTTAGVLDSTFGTNGVVTTDSTVTRNLRSDAKLQADGSIVVLAAGDVATERYRLARYTPAGVLDPTFGGLFSPSAWPIAGIDNAQRPALAIDAMDRLYVGGRELVDDHEGFVVRRYTAAGALDTAFATGGLRVIDTRPGGAAVRALRIQPDGKILVGGRIFTPTGASDFAIARLNP